jgi:hypothetical protein
MSLDIRWLVPVAVCAVAPQCIAAKYMSIEQAREQMFPFADEYVIQPLQLTPSQTQEIDSLSGVSGRGAQPLVWQAMARGKLIGWLFLDQVIGKHELITYALGVNTDGSVRQLQVIEYLETYGSQVRYPSWRINLLARPLKIRCESTVTSTTSAALRCRRAT